MIKKTEEVYKYGQMVVDMKVNGNKIRLTDMAGWCMLKVIFLKGIGAMIRRMAKVHTPRLMVASTKADGSKTNKTVLESKYGEMAPDMKACTKTA